MVDVDLKVEYKFLKPLKHFTALTRCVVARVIQISLHTFDRLQSVAEYVYRDTFLTKLCSLAHVCKEI